jgi:hypothetical protein
LPPNALSTFFSNRFQGFLPIRAKTTRSSEVTYLLGFAGSHYTILLDECSATFQFQGLQIPSLSHELLAIRNQLTP